MTLLSTARLVKEALGSSPASFIQGVENILFLLIQGRSPAATTTTRGIIVVIRDFFIMDFFKRTFYNICFLCGIFLYWTFLCGLFILYFLCRFFILVPLSQKCANLKRKIFDSFSENGLVILLVSLFILRIIFTVYHFSKKNSTGLFYTDIFI